MITLPMRAIRGVCDDCNHVIYRGEAITVRGSKTYHPACGPTRVDIKRLTDQEIGDHDALRDPNRGC